MHRNYDNGPSTAGLKNWDNFLSGVINVEGVVAENSTASLKGVGQWIWPVALAVVAVVIGFLFLRRKGK